MRGACVRERCNDLSLAWLRVLLSEQDDYAHTISRAGWHLSVEEKFVSHRNRLPAGGELSIECGWYGLGGLSTVWRGARHG